MHDDEIHNSFVAAFVQNFYTWGEISNVSRTVFLIGTRQAANDSAYVGLCGDLLYMRKVKIWATYENFRYDSAATQNRHARLIINLRLRYVLSVAWMAACGERCIGQFNSISQASPKYLVVLHACMAKEATKSILRKSHLHSAPKHVIFIQIKHMQIK